MRENSAKMEAAMFVAVIREMCITQVREIKKSLLQDSAWQRVLLYVIRGYRADYS